MKEITISAELEVAFAWNCMLVLSAWWRSERSSLAGTGLAWLRMWVNMFSCFTMLQYGKVCNGNQSERQAWVLGVVVQDYVLQEGCW